MSMTLKMWLARYSPEERQTFNERILDALQRYVGEPVSEYMMESLRKTIGDLVKECFPAIPDTAYRVEVHDFFGELNIDLSDPNEVSEKASWLRKEPLTVNAVVQDAVDHARRKGFLDEPVNLPTLVALIHEEASEILSELRTRGSDTPLQYEKEGKPEGLAIELADVVLRACTMAGYLKIDLERALRRKMEYNATRPIKHGRNF